MTDKKGETATEKKTAREHMKGRVTLRRKKDHCKESDGKRKTKKMRNVKAGLEVKETQACWGGGSSRDGDEEKGEGAQERENTRVK